MAIHNCHTKGLADARDPSIVFYRQFMIFVKAVPARRCKLFSVAVLKVMFKVFIIAIEIKARLQLKCPKCSLKAYITSKNVACRL